MLCDDQNMTMSNNKSNNHMERQSSGGSRKRPITNCENCSTSKKKPHILAEYQFLNANTKPAPLSTDPDAQKARDACDYSIKATMEEARSGKAARTVRVYADGIYDMFHNGHARQLMQAKCLLQNAYLIVGVCSQELTQKFKGRTVMAEADRYDSVRHCRYVDELLPDAPWVITDEFLEANKIDFVAHDELPYVGVGDDDIYKTIKERGMFLVTERTEGISTTDIIANILKDYDLYVRRNLAKGYTAKQLNVGFMKEKKIMLGVKYDKLLDKGKELRKDFIDKGQEIIHKWERNSKQFISNFLEVFGKDGRISTWLQEGTTRMVRAISPSSDTSLTRGSRSPSPYLFDGAPNPLYEEQDEDEEQDEEDEENEEDEEDSSDGDERDVTRETS